VKGVSKLKVLISKHEIDNKISELADQIRRDYEDAHPVVVGTLKGSFVFMSDLIRKLDLPMEVDFVRLSSYGAGTQTSGKVKMTKHLETHVRGRHVLLIEDIVDTGLSARFLLDYLDRRKPQSVRLCTLFDKPSRRLVEVPLHYVGFTVPDVFVVGCGLDFNEEYRYLPDLCILEEEGE
jgi:hypoxanthine phosphoribosyltransferase